MIRTMYLHNGRDYFLRPMTNVERRWWMVKKYHGNLICRKYRVQMPEARVLCRYRKETLSRIFMGYSTRLRGPTSKTDAKTGAGTGVKAGEAAGMGGKAGKGGADKKGGTTTGESGGAGGADFSEAGDATQLVRTSSVVSVPLKDLVVMVRLKKDADEDEEDDDDDDDLGRLVDLKSYLRDIGNSKVTMGTLTLLQRFRKVVRRIISQKTIQKAAAAVVAHVHSHDEKFGQFYMTIDQWERFAAEVVLKYSKFSKLIPKNEIQLLYRDGLKLKQQKLGKDAQMPAGMTFDVIESCLFQLADRIFENATPEQVESLCVCVCVVDLVSSIHRACPLL
jgi:hypothetical protein